MAFQPDIVVTSEDSFRVLMIVEAKLHSTRSERFETALKHYMWRSRCPVGLVVHPNKVAIFRDTFRRDDESAIEDVGTFAVPRIETSGTGLLFELSVQHWLDSIQQKTEAGDWEAKSWDAVSEIVLPALRSGIVRAAHPRLKTA